MSFNIGNVFIKNPLVMAPLAGITDSVFRRYAKEAGCGLVFSEMISAQGLHYVNKKTNDYLDYSPDEKPIGMQIFGCVPERMAEAARIVEAKGADIIDINLGCGVPKIAREGSGSALCRDMDLLAKVIVSVTGAVSVPVTIKIRKGFSRKEPFFIQIAHMAESLGVKAITLHARTVAGKFSEPPDWEAIAELKRAVRIPVIGNGGIEKPEDVKRMLDETGCDGVMAGRAILQGPWFWTNAARHLETGAASKPPLFGEVMEHMLRHVGDAMEYYGMERAMKIVKKYIAWYSKGLPGASDLRMGIYDARDCASLRRAIERHFEKIGTDHFPIEGIAS